MGQGHREWSVQCMNCSIKMLSSVVIASILHKGASDGGKWRKGAQQASYSASIRSSCSGSDLDSSFFIQFIIRGMRA